MLKYYDIINKLSDEDKIKILSDINALSDAKYRALGIPALKSVGAEEIGAVDYPKQAMLANTWNMPLIGRVAEDIACRALDADFGLLLVKGPRAAVNPYRSYLSEDPLLASSVSNEYLKAAERVGIHSALTGFGLYRDELEWIDNVPDKRLLAEYMVGPYRKAAANTGCAAIVTEPDVTDNEFGNVNTALSDAVYKGSVISGAEPLFSFKAAEKNALFAKRKGVFLECSANALSAALARYRKLSNDVEKGKATVEDLDSEIAEGSSVSPETVDEAVDRTIDLAFKVKRIPSPFLRSTDNGVALNAIRESAVLLKNENSVL